MEIVENFDLISVGFTYSVQKKRKIVTQSNRMAQNITFSQYYW